MVKDKLQLKMVEVKVEKEYLIQDIIEEGIKMANKILRESCDDVLLSDDSDMYDIGLSKKNGMMKTDMSRKLLFYNFANY